MSEAKFTKEVWSLVEDEDDGIFITGSYKDIAKICDSFVDTEDCLWPLVREEVKANGYLIEQAQRMYYMLETVVKDAEGYESRGGKPVTWVKEAKEVLSKARGENL